MFNVKFKMMSKAMSKAMSKTTSIALLKVGFKAVLNSAKVSVVSAAIVFVIVSAISAVALAHGVHANVSASAPTSSQPGAESKTEAKTEAPKAQPYLLGMKQMTFVGPRAGEGYFNRDGSLMIFQSERETENPFYQIYVLNRKTGKSVRLSPGAGKTTCAWIHPSNQKALFSSSHLDPLIAEKVKKEFDERKNPVKGKYAWSFDEEFDIFEAPLAKALKTGKPVEAKELKRLTKEKGYDAEASYSPDGKWIAFASNRSGYTETLNDEEQKIFSQDPSYMMDLYLMNADGSDVRRLTSERGYDGGPFFSPDGKRITWRRFSKNGQYAEIMAMDLKADGTVGKEKQLTSWKAMSWAPFFHPSGDYIIFTSNKLGFANFELFVVDAEGKNEPVRVSFLDGFDGLPVFLPNGDQLAWTRRDERGEAQIYVADWDDGLIRSKLGLARLAPSVAQGQQALQPEITVKDVKAWVSYLASEALKGRRSGTPEERIYTEAIAKYFAGLGLKPVHKDGFVQPFEFASGVKLGPLNRMRLREAGAAKEIVVEKDWMPISLSRSGDVSEAPVVFAGFGIVAQATDKLPAFDSYEGARVDGKWVVAIQDLPTDVSNEVRFQLNLFSRAQHRALIAKQKGAVGLILVEPSANADSRSASADLPKLKFEGASEVGIPVIQISSALAKRMFAGVKSLESRLSSLNKGETSNGAAIEELKVSLGGKVDLIQERSIGFNVIAKRPGKDPKLAPLVIGAHGDHLGKGDLASSLALKEEQGQAHVGADDNASGVAALLEIAHAGVKAPGQKVADRDVIYAVWGAEELGILGSTQFLSTHQGVKPSAYLNMDMVGRLRDALSVQAVGSSPEWRPLLEKMAAETAATDAGVALSLMNDPYLPTDAVAFYLKEIPTLAFFTGAHSEYHSPRDRYETLNYPGLVSVAKVVQHLAGVLSGKSIQPKWQKVEGTAPSGQSRSFRLFLGTVPDYSREGIKGVLISGTSKDSPAELAGLQAGDVITLLGGIKIESIYDYVYCLQALRADVEVPLQVVRAGKAVDLKITPRLKK